MKKTTIYLVLILFTNVLLAQTVNIEGNPYGDNPYATITDAIAAANAGDVILITGIHTEPISVQKSITLRGTNPTTDIIEAAETEIKNGTGQRVISLSPPVNTDVLTITIENLGLRHGNAGANGGAIFSDKIMGLLTLRNLIITNNYTSTNGGALGIAGSNVNFQNVIMQNNTANFDGGAIIAAPNNNAGSGINSVINIEQSLMDGNTGRNGGAIYINGNKEFGDNYKIEINVENTTISNNTATSPSGAVGGGAIWSKGSTWTGDGTTGNVSLNLIHTTIYNNTHAALIKSGINFTADPAGSKTNFSAYNSILVVENDLARKVFLNFGNAIISNVVNCIIGGIEGAVPAIISDANNNNLTGRTATQAGLTGTLSDEGGDTFVLPITSGSLAEDYCTAATGISIPTIDQRGFSRVGVNDAGAFEFSGVLSIENESFQSTTKIYPNPVQQTLYISSMNALKNIQIIDVTGKRVFESSNQNMTSVDVSNLNEGLYIVRLVDINMNLSTKKLLIAR